MEILTDKGKEESRMKQRIKKWFSVFLSAIMIIGVLPLQALAEDTSDAPYTYEVYAEADVNEYKSDGVVYESDNYLDVVNWVNNTSPAPSVDYTILVTRDDTINPTNNPDITITPVAALQFSNLYFNGEKGRDITITKGTNTGDRHIIFVTGTSDNSRLYVKNLTFDGAGNPGGIQAYSGPGLSLTDVEVKNCVSNSFGGAISVNSAYTAHILTLDMENCHIHDNQSTLPSQTYGGGGVYFYSNVTYQEGYVNIKNSVISSNSAEGRGGGIFVSGAPLTISDETKIYDNKTIYSQTAYQPFGGGIFTERSSVTLKDSEIYGNSGSFGGGVYMRLNRYQSTDSVFTMESSSIHDNEAYKGSGGGVAITNGSNSRPATFDMRGGTIRENTATDGDGGGVYLSRTGMTMSNSSTIKNNKVESVSGNVGGGASLYDRSTLKLYDDAEINGNTADTGGGVAAYQSVLEMYDNSAIRDNTAITETSHDPLGGGVYLYNLSTLTLKDNSGINNNTAGYGGGVYAAYDSSASFSDAATLKNNNASVSGGGACLYSDGNTDSAISFAENASVEGNTASYGGGVYLFKSATLTTQDTPSFKNNRATDEGGAIYTTDYTIDPTDGSKYAVVDTDYSNIITSDGTIFFDNTANDLYEPPAITDSFTNIGFARTSGENVLQTNHPLNNYDINHVFASKIPYYIVKYNANNGSDSYYSVKETVGNSHTVLSNSSEHLSYTHSGNTFLGWSTAPNVTVPDSGYAPGKLIGGTVAEGHTINLYAVWGKKHTPGSISYSVTYDANGGTGSHKDTSLSAGSTYTIRALSSTGITRSEYVFTGWNTKADGTGTAYSAADTFAIKSDVTLFAQWKSAKPELNTDDHMAYIVGYPSGNVGPEDNLTRAETATIFFRLLTPESRTEFWSTTNDYSDVTSADWFNNAVSTMSNAELIYGFVDGTFGGNHYVTRAQFAAIAARFDSDVYTGENKFSDIDGHWANKYINQAAEKGWVNGYLDGTFKPEQPITRAEAMALINRVLGRDKIEAMHTDMIVWPDNLESAWYFQAVQEATNSHNYVVNADGKETWTEVLTPPNWAALEKE